MSDTRESLARALCWAEEDEHCKCGGADKCTEWQNYDGYAISMAKALTAQGLAIVPIEPETEVLAAGQAEAPTDGKVASTLDVFRIYKAMLKANGQD